MPDSPWPPPATPAIGSSGKYLASDGEWYISATAPADGYTLAADGYWYTDLELREPWRTSRWGLGDVGWGVLMYFVASMAFGLIVVIALLSLDRDRSLENFNVGPYLLGLLVLPNLVVFAGVPWWASRRKGLSSLSADFGLHGRLRDVGIGLGLGVAALIASGITRATLDVLLSADEPTDNLPIDGLDTVGQLAMFVVAIGIVTPIIEELFFRGLVFRSLLKRGSRVAPAIAATTVIFVLPHLLAAGDWRAAVSLFGAIGAVGVVLNLACEWTGRRLAAPIVAHMVINCTAGLALFLT